LASVLPPAEALATSAHVAPWAVSDAMLFRVPRVLERLVSLAPTAWADAVSNHLRQPHSIFASAAPIIIGHLPLEARRQVLASQTAADIFPLPWVTDEGVGISYIRPDDALARMRFDAGVELEGAGLPQGMAAEGTPDTRTE
jgi:hypothetical protein